MVWSKPLLTLLVVAPGNTNITKWTFGKRSTLTPGGRIILQKARVTEKFWFFCLTPNFIAAYPLVFFSHEIYPLVRFRSSGWSQSLQNSDMVDVFPTANHFRIHLNQIHLSETGGNTFLRNFWKSVSTPHSVRAQITISCKLTLCRKYTMWTNCRSFILQLLVHVVTTIT